MACAMWSDWPEKPLLGVFLQENCAHLETPWRACPCWNRRSSEHVRWRYGTESLHSIDTRHCGTHAVISAKSYCVRWSTGHPPRLEKSRAFATEETAPSTSRGRSAVGDRM